MNNPVYRMGEALRTLWHRLAWRIAGIIASVATLFAASAATADDTAKSHPDSRLWRDVFAADLSNALCPTGVWSWTDGVLSPKGKDEVIWTKDEHENFTLDLEFKLEAGGNSGVIVYSTETGNWPPNAMEIQVLDDGSPKWAHVPANWKCGGIFGHSAPKRSAVKKPGEWNRMTIDCRGQKISVLLNGHLVTDINMADWKSGKTAPDGSAIVEFEPRPLAEMATRGRIGLQGAHGGVPTHFRNLKISTATSVTVRVSADVPLSMVPRPMNERTCGAIFPE